MNRRIAKGIVIGLAAAALVGGLTACGSNSTAEKPYDVLVTYNYNVSHLLDSVDCPTQYLGLPRGGYAKAPGFAENFNLGVLEHGYIEGWYQAKCDEEGNPLDEKGHLFRQDSLGNAIKADAEGYLLKEDGENYLVTKSGERLFLSVRGMLFSEKKNTPFKMNSRGQVTSQDEKTSILDENGENLFVTRVKVALDMEKKWNFSSDRVEEDLTLYANFIDTPRIIVLDEEGQEVAFYDGAPGSRASVPSVTNQPRKEGFTFYGFYSNLDPETPMEDTEWTTYVYPTVSQLEGGQFPTKTVYAKFIEGTWSIIRAESELALAFSNGNNIYIDANLTFGDGKGGTTEFPTVRNFDSEFNGNKHTISGITLSLSGTMDTATDTGFGLFGTLKSTAYIHDVTFVDAQVNLKGTAAPRTYYAGLLAGRAEEGATIENVTISGKLTIGTINRPEGLISGKLIGRNDGAIISGTSDENIELDYPGAP